MNLDPYLLLKRDAKYFWDTVLYLSWESYYQKEYQKQAAAKIAK